MSWNRHRTLLVVDAVERGENTVFTEPLLLLIRDRRRRVVRVHVSPEPGARSPDARNAHLNREAVIFSFHDILKSRHDCAEPRSRRPRRARWNI